MKTAQLRVYDSGWNPVGTVKITDAAVRTAIDQYEALYPANDYPRTDQRPHIKTWFQNNAYTYAIRYKGKCYPPKQILRIAITIGHQHVYGFYGGGSAGNANWVLEELGFEIISKQECRKARLATRS